MDSLTPQQRSTRMSLVKGKNTGPEIAVRRLVHSLGYRYRIHVSCLPGKPDLVFASRRKVIFVHGCFWHGHSCALGRMPKSRLEFWKPKLEGNKVRDRKNVRRLRTEGWRALTIWECQTRDLDRVGARVKEFLDA